MRVGLCMCACGCMGGSEMKVDRMRTVTILVPRI